MRHETRPAGIAAEAGNMDHQGAVTVEDVEGDSIVPSSTYAHGYNHNQRQSQLFAGDSYSAGGAYSCMVGGDGGNDPEAVEVDDPASAAAFATYNAANGGHNYTVDDGHGGRGHAAAAADDASSYALSADPEGALLQLREQRQQYRSWVSQYAAAALASLDTSYGSSTPYNASSRHGSAGGVASGLPADSIPDDVSGLVTAMDVAGTVRQYLLSLKVAAEAIREAARACANFEALSLPVTEVYKDANEAAAAAAAETEFVTAAYGVTAAVAEARRYLERMTELAGSPAAALVKEVLDLQPASGVSSTSVAAGGPLGPAGEQLLVPLAQKLDRVGSGLRSRLHKEAEALMELVQWPPPLAEGGGGAGGDREGSGSGGDAAFAGFDMHPLQARRLAGVLTALTHYQMAVEHHTAFRQLLEGQVAKSGGDGGDEEGAPAASPMPLLWAVQVLAKPVAAKLRAHFHPAAPIGRLDRPAWLYDTVLGFIRQHGHALVPMDDMLACLQLKPHYNMPAEFARALQQAVLDLLMELRIPAILELRKQKPEDVGDAAIDATSVQANGAGGTAAAAEEADALLLGLMDASAAYDIALLPLLGATGPRVEADAAKAQAMLAAASSAGAAVLQRRRACDQFDPTASGTADMHARYVAAAARPSATAAGHLARGNADAAAAALPSLLQAWAEAEGAAALRAAEAVAYDDSSLAPAEEAAAQALGGGGLDELSSGLRPSSSISGSGGGPPPWQRDTWPPLLAREAARLLDGLVARSKWLSADPVRQREFLETASRPMLSLLRRRLGRLVDQAVSRGEVVSEEGLPKVCAALCAAHFMDDHLQSLLLTDLAPLAEALDEIAATAARMALDDATAAADPSDPPTPSSSFAVSERGGGGNGGGGGGILGGKLDNGGGIWSGMMAAAAGSGSGMTSSPARVALRDGVTALAVGTGGGAGSLGSAAAGSAAAAAAAAASRLPPVLADPLRSFARLHRDGCLKLSRELALGFGRCSVAYRHAIEANPQFPFTPESDAGGDDGSEGGGAANGNDNVNGSFSGGFFGMARPASSITPSFGPALLFLQSSLERLSRCCDKPTFADVWRGAALSINRFMFNFIATESRFSRAGARQFAADVGGLAQLFTPYSRRGAGCAGTSRSGSFSAAALRLANGAGGGGGGGGGAGAGGQHFRELQAAARLLCLSDEEAADVMRRASAAAVAAQTAAARTGGAPSTNIASTPTTTPTTTTTSPSTASQPALAPTHSRGDPVRTGMSTDPVLSSAGLACLSPLQIMNVIEHRI
ncbi:hypothetical protein VaNZ11_006716 [Volvox africanus]|uniref:Exocyst complex component Sec8 n=1 Tax=Volvox africanus TaxID=51714 RepID=A0ABQ5S1C5_9CHLO|nr:hypothetical protein VaNZ11_006716 [Volvox africanus]